MYKNQYVNFSKKELNFQGGYYGKVEAEHFKMQRLLFMYECMRKSRWIRRSALAAAPVTECVPIMYLKYYKEGGVDRWQKC